MAENKGDAFKFVDRRRVDAEGNDRGVDEKSGEGKANKASPPKTAQSQAAGSSGATRASGKEPEQVGNSGDGAMTIGFAEFVMSFATQALMQLGQMQPPAGVNIPKDVKSAKQTIDIIQMLEDKTKGNLDQAETALLSDILHNLRLAYLNVSKGK